MVTLEVSVQIRRIFSSATECRFTSFGAVTLLDPQGPGETTVETNGDITQIIPATSAIDGTDVYISLPRNWEFHPDLPIYISTSDFASCKAPNENDNPITNYINTILDTDAVKAFIPKSTTGSQTYYYALQVRTINPVGTYVWLHPKIRNDNSPNKDPRRGFVTRFIRDHPLLAMLIAGGVALVAGIYLGGGWR